MSWIKYWRYPGSPVGPNSMLRLENLPARNTNPSFSLSTPETLMSVYALWISSLVYLLVSRSLLTNSIISSNGYLVIDGGQSLVIKAWSELTIFLASERDRGDPGRCVFLQIVRLASPSLFILPRASFLASNKHITLLAWGYTHTRHQFNSEVLLVSWG